MATALISGVDHARCHEDVDRDQALAAECDMTDDRGGDSVIHRLCGWPGGSKPGFVDKEHLGFVLINCTGLLSPTAQLAILFIASSFFGMDCRCVVPEGY